MKCYIHYTLGRIRIQSPVLFKNAANAEKLTELLKSVRGITRVETQPLTGSATTYYDEKVINCEQIIGILELHGYFSLSEATTLDQLLENVTEKAFGIGEAILEDEL